MVLLCLHEQNLQKSDSSPSNFCCFTEESSLFSPLLSFNWNCLGRSKKKSGCLLHTLRILLQSITPCLYRFIVVFSFSDHTLSVIYYFWLKAIPTFHYTPGYQRQKQCGISDKGKTSTFNQSNATTSCVTSASFLTKWSTPSSIERYEYVGIYYVIKILYSNGISIFYCNN